MSYHARGCILAVILALAVGALPVSGQEEGGYRLAATLQAPAPTAEGWFGNSVAMDTERVIVGEAFGDAGSVRRAGRAYVFTHDGQLVCALQSPSPRKEANFGGAEWENKLVGVGADRFCVGETGAPGGGQVHLFAADGTLVASISPPGGMRGRTREFGNSVAAAGDRILVGAWNAGAYLFDSAGTLVASLKAADGTVRDGFGMAVVFRGDTIVVTQDHATAGGVREAGMAYLYDAGGGLKKALQAPEPQAGGLFGVSAAGDGELVAIGSPVAGLAYLFTAEGEPLSVLSSPVPSAAFGVSVAVDGGRIIVGASAATVDGQRGAGLAFVFDRNGTRVATLRPPRAVAGAGFGYSVAAVGGKVAVGAYGDEAGGRAVAGKVYLFTAP